ncbi:hypothetical protein B0H14DRAFT_2567654 [Mycena olivaceomarginata]|nr:hypothetical protein B0H14DRAFT_2567654 [Mycena olivaceomarginata]
MWIHELDATGKVALNSIIQSSNWVPPKADTWTGRNWQGSTQSNNPEFGSGTTKGGYMDWMQLARVRIGYYRKRIHELDATGKVGPNPIIQSSDWVPPHEWDATSQVVIQYSGSLMASVAEPLYPKSGPRLRARNTNVKQVETNPRSVRNTGVNSGPFLRLVCLRTAYVHDLPGADSSSSPSRHDEVCGLAIPKLGAYKGNTLGKRHKSHAVLVGISTNQWPKDRKETRVSREEEGTDDKTTQFVGPYALKIYYADHASECYRDDLIGESRKGGVRNVLLPTWEWRYGDTLSMRGFGSDVLLQYKNFVRGWMGADMDCHHETRKARHPPIITRTDHPTTKNGNAVVPNVASNREEVFAQSDLKRIASLEEMKLVHRDLSIGNWRMTCSIAASLPRPGLARRADKAELKLCPRQPWATRTYAKACVLLKGELECPVEFWSEAAAFAKAILNVNITFTQRTREIGLLHDMDMAGRAHSLPPPATPTAGTATGLVGKLRALKLQPGPEATEPAGPLRGFRTGTPPFMAIELLKEGPPHLVVYDLHSLSFVMLLFLWIYEHFSDVRFRGRVSTNGRPWPRKVMRWANRPADNTLVELFLRLEQVVKDHQ